MEKKIEKEPLETRIKKFPGIGILFALLAGFFFATGSLSVKMVTSISGAEVAIVRSFIITVCMLITAIVKRQSLRPVKGERLPLFLRTIFGSVGLIISYSALKLIPLGDAYSIQSASPVFVAVFACVLLKEPFGLIQIVSLILVLSGIFLISKPSFIFPKDDDELYADTRGLGVFLAICSSVTLAGAIITLRKLRHTPTAVVVAWFSLVTTIAATIVCLSGGELRLPATKVEYVWLVLCGVCGTFAQGLLTLALKLENAGTISLLRTVDVFIAFVNQVTVLNGPLPWTSLAGAMILVLAVALIATEKWYKTDQEGFKRFFLCQKSSKKETASPTTKISGRDVRVRVRSRSSLSTIEFK